MTLFGVNGPGRKKRVRRPSQVSPGQTTSPSAPRGLAHTSGPVLIQLNDHWRIVEDDLQYIVERRKGKARSKASGWRPRLFCRQRKTLLRCIREHCGEVNPLAMEQVRALPACHIDR
jgi:hypothetical protein